MKKLNTSSILMAIACLFLSIQTSFAQSSADCQSEVNLSVGAGCTTSIPYEAFNSWRPSCMIIKQNGVTQAVLAGSGSFSNSAVDCSMMIDSVWIDTIIQTKVNSYLVPMWTISCTGGTPDTIYADLASIPTLCNADTLVRDVAGIGIAQPINGRVVLSAHQAPTCAHSTRSALDGDLIFRDTVTTYTFKQHVAKVSRVDTFSHTDAMKWIKGTIILSVNGTDSIVHGFTPEDGKKTVLSCGESTSLSALFPGILAGPAALKPGAYEFNSYSADSLNYCWGKLNVEYKLWPAVASKKDTISCVDVTTFDRSPEGGHYDYNAHTSEKLEDVCEWAEQIYTGSTQRSAPSGGVPGVGAMRSAARVQWEMNRQVRHCYVHTVTTSDRYIKDFNWICDTVVKERTFIADKPGHGGGTTTGVIVKDTLLITPLTLDDVIFPDSVVTMKCGILDGDSPDEVAEYLYKSYKHFNNTNVGVITGRTTGASSDFIIEKPCDAFATQYNDYGLSLSKSSSLTNDQLWEKVFKGADYNNWGVQKAFPHVIRNNKLTDNGLKNKIDILINGGDVTKSSTFSYAVEGVKIPINKVVCNIAATHLDLNPIQICGGERKIFRQWTLVDWCTGTTREMTQIIKFEDAEAPVITGISDKSTDDYFETTKKTIATGAEIGVRVAKITSPWGCYAQYQFPRLNLKEHCSEGKYSFQLLDASLDSDGKTYGAGEIVNLSWTYDDGFTHPIVKVKLYDECGNEGTYYYYLKGKDALPPVVIVNDEINVTLTADKSNGDGQADGIAKIFCSDVDAGSHDGDCGEIASCKIRIKDSGDEWADFVHFDCGDVGQQTVEFQAIDHSGNASIGWTLVNVENKISASLFCEDVTVGCTDPVHPDWIGYPHVAGICSTPDLEFEDEYQIDDLCFKGKILRTWTITNSSPKITCVQTIYIDDTDDGGDDSKFDPKSIKFPLHHTGQTLAEAKFSKDWVVIRDLDGHNVCRDAGDASDDDLNECTMNDAFICEIGVGTEPTWDDPECGLVGKTFEDQVVEFGEGACHKILRHWAVIDWCSYDAKKGDVYEDEVEYVKDKCNDYNYFRLRADSKGEIHEDGYYSYTQEIKIFDDMAPEVDAPDVDVEVGLGGKDDEECIVDAVIVAKAKDFCGGSEAASTHGSLKWSVSVTEVDEYGNVVGSATTDHTITLGSDDGYATASITLTGEASHNYRVKWTAKDGCNNAGQQAQLVRFLDIKAPVILCIGELSTSTMNTDGSTEIWANDFAEAFDCNGKEAYVWFRADDGALVPGLRFECSDLGGNASTAISLQVIATDDAGNESYCNVSLRIIDSDNTCGNDDNTGAALIAGEVRTEIGDMVESAVISMKEDNIMTSTDGAFAFSNNPVGYNYSINAEKSDDHLNGVSTLDLVLIQKHILGLESLNSPYKVIAADINNDENVSAIDLVQLRKLILGIYDELPNNDSWRFSDANATFDDANDPFPFTESIDVDFLTENRMNEDFIAIKIGDVSGNAIANSLIAGGRNNASITLTAQDAQVSAGQSVRVAITSDEFEGINALQFTMGLSGLKYTAIESGALEMNDDNVAIFEGRMTAAWYNVDAVNTDETLFTLVFTALENTTLSNAISIGSEITKAEAYNSNNEGADVALAFETGEGLVNGATFELFQNQPNPFDNITTIGFQLAEVGAAKMTVFDVTGKIVTTVQGQYTRGYNEITLSKNDLDASGVLYYQLESGEFTATRKMILID